MFVAKQIQIPIYDRTLFMIISDNYHDANKFLRSKCTDVPEEVLFNEDHITFATTISGYRQVGELKLKAIYLVLNPNHDYDNLTAGTIAHEVVHIKNNIYNHMGEEVSTVYDEPEAYLSGWLTDTIVQFLHEHNISLSINKHRYNEN